MNYVITLMKDYFVYCYNLFINQAKRPPIYLLLFFYTTLNAGSVTVSWDANTENDLAGYRIYYGESSGNYNNYVYAGNKTSFQISGLEVGIRHFFAVTSIDFIGNESAYSNEVSAVISKKDDEEPPNDAQSLSTLVYNFPNPFKIPGESTFIRYELESSTEIIIEIFDMNNQLVKTLVKNELKGVGEHTEDVWDGTNSTGQLVANGVYICRIQLTDVQKFVKIAVIR